MVHISALTFTYDTDLTPIAKRIETEGFNAVAQSLPLNYGNKIGWTKIQDLVNTQFAPAATLKEGETARMTPELSPGFVHVDQIIPEMTCDRAVALRPQDPTPRMLRAAIETNAGAYADAAADYRVAAQSSDYRTGQAAHSGLATVLYRQGNYRDALASANEGSDNPDGYTTLRAMIEEALGENDLATADAAKGSDPYFLAQAYSHLGYFAASNDQLNAIAKQEPRRAELFTLRGFNGFSTGDTGNAARDFTAALAIDPHAIAANIGLAMMAYAAGNMSSAQHYAQQGLAVTPHDPYAILWELITSGHAPAHPTHLQPCEPGFYSGIYELQQGHKQEAQQLLRVAATKCPYREYERAAALLLLSKIKSPKSQ
jgi:hypothetical protein